MKLFSLASFTAMGLAGLALLIMSNLHDDQLQRVDCVGLTVFSSANGLSPEEVCRAHGGRALKDGASTQKEQKTG